jgi:hypothetical protein
LLPHPTTERGQQGRGLCNGLFRQPFRPYAGASGIAQEQASAPLEIAPVHVPVSRASTSIQVSDKLLDQMFVKRANRTTRSRCPIHKVLGRPNVPPSGYLRVARLTHLVSKPFKQAAIRAVA